jgi:hypothetical protein
MTDLYWPFLHNKPALIALVRCDRPSAHQARMPIAFADPEQVRSSAALRSASCAEMPQRGTPQAG